MKKVRWELLKEWYQEYKERKEARRVEYEGELLVQTILVNNRDKEQLYNQVRQRLEAGANPNHFSIGYSNTPLIAAAENGNVEVIELLIQKGANVNKPRDPENDGLTPLMAAAAGDHSEVVKVLIEAGANVNAADVEGMTALMMAAQNGKFKATEALLTGGADKNVTNRDEKTAFDLAHEKNHVSIAYMIREHRFRKLSSPSRGSQDEEYKRRFGKMDSFGVREFGHSHNKIPKSQYL